MTFNTGTIAFVVHDAAEIILSSFSKIESLTPYTIFLISPLPGAVNIAFAAPEFMCT